MCELADKPIEEVQVTPDTFYMLMREWGAQSKYEWTSHKYTSVDLNLGSKDTAINMMCPWGRVRIRAGVNDA